MKIVTWNVRYENKKKETGLKYVLSKDPDVICLQELPKKNLEWLKQNSSNYHLAYTKDMVNKNEEKSSHSGSQM